MKKSTLSPKVAKVVAALKSAKVPYTLELEESQFLGVELVPGQWSWFEVGEKGVLHYNHTYSQNTGRSKKSARGKAIKDKALARVIGFVATV